MKAIVRNVLLACLISTFAFFGALGGKHVKPVQNNSVTIQQAQVTSAESRKETLTCLGVAFLAWALCFWRCSVINRRINEERIHQHRFNEYMRSNLYNSRRY